MPGAIAGLWFVKNNRKHKPEFFMRRVGELAIQVAEAGLDMAFFHDGREGTNDIVHAKYEQTSPTGRYWHTAVALDDLPYQAWAQKLDPTCPSKWGKPLPRGSLQEFNKIWLSKIWVCWHMAVEKRSAGLCHTSWIWLDAGLSDAERKRAMQSVKEIGKPAPGAVYMQKYPPGMLKAPAHYFRNRCPVVHKINAKVIWSDRAGFTLLRAAFDECLAKLAMAVGASKEADCECFDEETVLTHMYDQVGPCAELDNPPPELRPIQVIDPNKKA